MFKCVNKLLPPIFDDLFFSNKDIHHYGTRQKNKLPVPKAKLPISEKIWGILGFPFGTLLLIRFLIIVLCLLTNRNLNVIYCLMI